MGDFAIKSLNSTAQQLSVFEKRSFNTASKTHSITAFENTSIESFAVSKEIRSINASTRSDDPRFSSKRKGATFSASVQPNFTELNSAEKAAIANCYKASVQAIEKAQTVVPTEIDPLKTYEMNFKSQHEIKLHSKVQNDRFQPQQPNKAEMHSQIEQLKAESKKITTQLETSSNDQNTSQTKPMKVSEIYFRFFKLLARIIEQAEGDAYMLYKSAKERTDQCERLNLLYGKLLGTPGKIDWSKDEEMKKLIEEAKALGVVIPEHNGKYQWSEEQKKSFIENVRTKKDSLDKLTQMEKTDLQRYMQIATNGHEWRSNLLKMWEAAARTITRNFSPG